MDVGRALIDGKPKDAVRSALRIGCCNHTEDFIYYHIHIYMRRVHAPATG